MIIPGPIAFGLMARKLDRDRAEERIARAELSGAARVMSTSSSESLRLLSLIGNCINHKPLKIHSGLICGAESALLEIVGVEERQRCVETKKCEARQPRCARPAPALSPPPDQAKPPSASAPIPSSIVRPRACEQQSAKRNVDSGQQPQHRPAGRCRSVCVRAL